MSVARICPDHLLSRARAGTLSGAESSQLEAHLRQCGVCRVALQVGRAFDAAGGPRPGDDRVAARLWREIEVAGRRRQPRRWAWMAAAASVLLASLATAAMVPAVRRALPLFGPAAGDANRREVGGPARSERARPASGGAQAERPSDGVPAPSAEPAPPEAAGEPPPAPAAKGSAARTNRAAPAADLLFSQANAARRNADVRKAVALYHELQRLHPAAPEALVSRVALGRLLLERAGDARGALAEFDGYLARAPEGALAEEALFGKASALMRLGRASEEKQTWRRLIERFPSSVYAERARERLEPDR